MQKGDIVYVHFPFTDLLGNKLRPVVVLFVSENDLTVCFMTSQIRWKTENDIVIQPSQLNGLNKSSLIRVPKIATVDSLLVSGRLGSCSFL